MPIVQFRIWFLFLVHMNCFTAGLFCLKWLVDMLEILRKAKFKYYNIVYHACRGLLPSKRRSLSLKKDVGSPLKLYYMCVMYCRYVRQGKCRNNVCFHMLSRWIQLPGHLCAPQGIDMGGGGSSSYRNETLTGLEQVNIVKCFWYDLQSVEGCYINEINR